MKYWLEGCIYCGNSEDNTLGIKADNTVRSVEMGAKVVVMPIKQWNDLWDRLHKAEAELVPPEQQENQ